MKKLLLSLVLTLGALGMATSANAGETAATSELPAALVALGGQQQVLSTQEAEQVRGEGLFLGLGAKAHVRAYTGAYLNVAGIKVKTNVKVKAHLGLGLGLGLH